LDLYLEPRLEGRDLLFCGGQRCDGSPSARSTRPGTRRRRPGTTCRLLAYRPEFASHGGNLAVACGKLSLEGTNLLSTW